MEGVLVSDVPAKLIEWEEPPVYMKNDRWHAPPGSMIRTQDENRGFSGFLIACPQCGQIGSARDGAKWTVTGGTLDDVTGLTLNPSILKNCCGWHGWLVCGVFTTKAPGT